MLHYLFSDLQLDEVHGGDDNVFLLRRVHVHEPSDGADRPEVRGEGSDMRGATGQRSAVHRHTLGCSVGRSALARAATGLVTSEA